MKSFADILSEKMGKSEEIPSHRPSKSETWISDLDLKPVWFSSRKYNHVAPQKRETKPWSPEHIPAPYRAGFQFFHQHGALEITEFSSQKALKSAFRRLAFKLHPDTHSNEPDWSVEQTKRLFIELQAHYKSLATYLATLKRVA